MWLLVLFLAVPLIEIALFIQVGGWLTLWPTLAIVLATGIIGTILVRKQGLGVLMQLRRSGQGIGNPLSPLAHGALILFAGALLLTPGFFTDTVGFLLLVPAIRDLVIRFLAARVTVYGVGAAPQAGNRQERGRGPDYTVIDAEFFEIDDTDDASVSQGKTGRDQGSGWTRH